MGSFDDAIAGIEKDFGKGALMRMGDKGSMNVEFVSTGCLALDKALGGGIGLGRITEIFGPESSGKSTLALHIVKEAQRRGMDCAYVDAEHSLDPAYAADLGVDIDNLLINQPDFGEQGMEITARLTRAGTNGLVVVDSVAALTPRAELDGEIGDANVGGLARLMSQSMRVIAAACERNKVSVVFINQLREKIGVMFGSPITQPGGRALKFYASQRMDIARIGSIKDGDEVTGAQTRVKVVKNKLSPPYRQAEMDLIYGEGFSREAAVINFGIEMGLIGKSGAWFSIDGKNVAQGREKFRTYLKENPELTDNLEAQIRESI